MKGWERVEGWERVDVTNFTCHPVNYGMKYVHGRTTRGGHGVPKVLPRPAMPYLSTPCRHWKGRSDSTRRPTQGPLRRIHGSPGDLRQSLMDVQRVRRSLAVWVEGWIPTDDSPYLLQHLPPGSGERGVGLPLYLSEVAAAKLTLQQEACRCARPHPLLWAATDSHLHRWLSCGWS
jgi:hypothetical protein